MFDFQLPGETETQAHQRSEDILSDYYVMRHYDREKYAFDKASAIYLARVVSHSPGTYPQGADVPSSVVHPVHALKGILPAKDQTLSGMPAGGMCWDIGDGEGAFQPAGELTVVFAGLPTSDRRPRGVDSFPVLSIRIVELLDVLRAFGKDLE